MKIKLKQKEWYFPGVKHYIVAELANGKFRFFKSDSILSVSATHRIVKKLQETSPVALPIVEAKKPAPKNVEANLLNQFIAEKSQLEDHMQHGELHEYIDDNAGDLHRLLSEVIQLLSKGAEQDAA